MSFCGHHFIHSRIVDGGAHPAAQAILPQLGSCPKMADLTKEEATTDLAIFLAAALSCAPLTWTSIKQVAPSPSHAIDLASPCSKPQKAGSPVQQPLQTLCCPQDLHVSSPVRWPCERRNESWDQRHCFAKRFIHNSKCIASVISSDLMRTATELREGIACKMAVVAASNCLASSESESEIVAPPESPLARPKTVSFVLVSPSTDICKQL